MSASRDDGMFVAAGVDGGGKAMTLPPGTPTVDLTASGSSGSIDSGVFQTSDLQSSGAGVFNSFVQIQHDGTEQGYNTDHAPQFNEKSNVTHNHSVLLAAV